MFMACTLTWESKLQSKISLSTMEAEYISLSQYMSEIIGIRKVIKEIQNFVISGKTQNQKYCPHSKAFFLDSIPTSNIYEDNYYGL